MGDKRIMSGEGNKAHNIASNIAQMIQVVCGPRQVGKSTMVKQVLHETAIPNTAVSAAGHKVFTKIIAIFARILKPYCGFGAMGSGPDDGKD